MNTFIAAYVIYLLIVILGSWRWFKINRGSLGTGFAWVFIGLPVALAAYFAVMPLVYIALLPKFMDAVLDKGIKA